LAATRKVSEVCSEEQVHWPVENPRRSMQVLCAYPASVCKKHCNPFRSSNQKNDLAHLTKMESRTRELFIKAEPQ
jgi:hypothetical protein